MRLVSIRPSIPTTLVGHVIERPPAEFGIFGTE
jgi:hypothetical protein